MRSTSARAEIEVAVDPLHAFTAFTAEIDQWWVPGPINYFRADVATGMEIEPGLGGRVLEHRDPHPALVIAEVIDWQPGRLLKLRGIVDDTETEIRFDPTVAGTRIRVHQYLLPGGTEAFLFWPNVLGWLIPYVEPSPSKGK
ncbi:hypothetical protein FOE78_03250 [Microlunatus elymi]|uniref:Activator of Hsp90 ATPase homolog 1-like protein n=1 Tax=Microlunatus elymi TaxID=2596828 RepID=A0A516PV40_9ACTN|nr:hypothetical protein [Microlunatus elymi]QDP95058.1 hypothetical protein FOE78_03250 [Microlunatus elymi]